MSKKVANLEPKIVWKNFAKLNEVPRPSKKEEKVIKFMKKFGENLGLETIVDKIGNVIIKKPATKGMSKRTPVILQGHLDMVCQKNNDTTFDFDKEGIKMFIEGDWVKAKGTTLGADNGMGVAMAMALLESKDIPHPPLEALFTIDEETGMTGAIHLQPGMLDGKILLNLDSEDDTELTIGCAGGIDINVTNTYKRKRTPMKHAAFKLTVNGLKGGHSGMEIHLGRGNANKIMNRIIWNAQYDFGLCIHSIDGGGLRNAIPRESVTILTLPKKKVNKFEQWLTKETADIISEYASTDPDLAIKLKKTTTPNKIMKNKCQKNMVASIYAAPNGIYRLSPDVKGLVQTSNNVARVLVKEGKIEILNLTRSSVDSEKMDLAHSIKSCFELSCCNVEMTGSYPGWAPDAKASINNVMVNNFVKSFDFKPDVTACHAGLECGIIKKTYPKVDMISFGPNIRGAHSPDERVQISSVAKIWRLLLGTLADFPIK